MVYVAGGLIMIIVGVIGLCVLCGAGSVLYGVKQYISIQLNTIL